MTKYLYSVVRFVPDPARGEYVNVGVIVGSDEAREWEFRAAESLLRARRLDHPERPSLPAVAGFIESLGRQVDDFSEAVEDGDPPPEGLSEAWLFDEHRSLEHVVQMSRPTPVRASSATEAVSLVFNELVVEPLQERLPYLRRTRAAAALRQAYKTERAVPVFESVRIEAGSHGTQVDFVVANGHVVQLAQAWSFQVPDQKRLVERIRSWGWTMERLAEVGGIVRLPGNRAEHVDAGVNLEIVYVAPREEQVDSSAFSDGMSVFDEVGAHVLPHESAAEIAQRAVELLQQPSELLPAAPSEAPRIPPRPRSLEPGPKPEPGPRR